MFLGRTAKDKDIIDVSKTEIQIFEDLVHETEVWVALRRPKDIKGNSKRRKVVVIAVFWMSAGWTGI